MLLQALYSESYENVAVMFVAIPEFQAFYSEEHFNNDGLECIRFLNEIISDFDEVGWWYYVVLRSCWQKLYNWSATE